MIQDDLVGPLWLTFQKDSERYCFSFSETGTISLVPLLLSDIQPAASGHVVVGQFIGDKSHFSIKTPHGRYIGYDKHGFIEVTKEAIGPHELWVPIFVDGKNDEAPHVILQRKAYNTEVPDMYLQYDFNCKCLRADIETREDATKFFIFHRSTRCAHKLIKESAARKALESAAIDISHYEYDQMRRYMSWYDRKLDSVKQKMNASSINLKTAEANGQLHSALLDRREKLKSDKYCK